MLTIQQAAQQANCHRDTLMRAIKSQKLPAHQVKGKFRMEWRIKESDLTAWMQTGNQNVVTLPVAQYADMQQSLQATTALATALMAEIRTMQTNSAQQADATSAQLAEIADMMRIMSDSIREVQKAQQAKKKPGLFARLFRRG